nr:unnamed protein product [Callosobruchus analis]
MKELHDLEQWILFVPTDTTITLKCERGQELVSIKFLLNWNSCQLHTENELRFNHQPSTNIDKKPANPISEYTRRTSAFNWIKWN